MAETKRKHRILVGEAWPDGIEIAGTEFHAPWKEPRTVIITGVALLIGLLLLAFTAYGMVTQDKEIFDRIFAVLDRSVYLVAGWLGGRSIMKPPS